MNFFVFLTTVHADGKTPRAKRRTTDHADGKPTEERNFREKRSLSSLLDFLCN
ncbi:MAG: hypothetical protein LBT33_09760 [Spirochaetia bacterium]|nr:hypothetical protein [Spirochaetia bacterium]